jgi:hypothetical protein
VLEVKVKEVRVDKTDRCAYQVEVAGNYEAGEASI